MIDSFAGKRVVVTGATGLIGSRLASKLLEMQRTKVVAMGRNMQKLRLVFSKFLANGNLELCAHDISRPLPHSLGVADYIFHAAGPVSGNIIKSSPTSAIAVNVMGVSNCLDYIVMQKSKLGVDGRVCVFSSATVYGCPHDIDKIVVECDTDSAELLDSIMAPYSESKRMAEVIARAYVREFGIDVLIARIGYVYGASVVPQANAFSEFLGNAYKNKDLVFQHSKFPRRDNIFVDDAVSGVLCVALRGATGEAYNVSSGGGGGNYVAIDEIAQEIANVANCYGGMNIAVKGPKSFVHEAGIILNNDKLVNLGWAPLTTLVDGIKRTFIEYGQLANNTAVPCAFRRTPYEN